MAAVGRALCGLVVANFGLLNIGRFGRYQVRSAQSKAWCWCPRGLGPGIDYFVVSSSKATFVRSGECTEHAPTSSSSGQSSSHVRDALTAHRLWSLEHSTDQVSSTTVGDATHTTKKFARRSTREHRTKTSGTDETGFQHDCSKSILSCSQKQMSTCLLLRRVVSRLKRNLVTSNSDKF